MPVAIPEPEKDAGASNGSGLDTQQNIAEAEKLAAQPEKPSENPPAVDAQPVNAESTATAPAAASDDPEEKTSPQPVSVEEVQDAELPIAKPLEADAGAKPESTVLDPAQSTPAEENKDTEMTDTQEPDIIPVKESTKADADKIATDTAKTEPQVGDKRKVDEVSAVNGDAAEAAPEAGVPTEKKQKLGRSASNGIAKKAGRPKKEKKEPAPVGKTARKTRSQAALD